MKTLREDIKHLRPHLVLCFMALLLCAGVAFATWRFALLEETALRQAQTQGRELQGRLANAAADARDADPLALRYREIAARAWLGEERRLEWAERIVQIKQTRRLFDMRYELAPRQPAAPDILPNGSVAGSFEFMSSTMKLQMQLLHEQDLLDFLDDLSGSVSAFLRVRACKLERIAPEATDVEVTPRLAAECALDWITLREPT